MFWYLAILIITIIFALLACINYEENELPKEFHDAVERLQKRMKVIEVDVKKYFNDLLEKTIEEKKEDSLSFTLDSQEISSSCSNPQNFANLPSMRAHYVSITDQ